MPTSSRSRVLTGLDILARIRPKWLRGRRLGLLMHPASVTADFVSARDVVARLFPRKLSALFGPQHGFSGEKQDNMVESPHGYDTDMLIPVFSLYSETRSPTPEMLEGIDLLLVDLQDVGTRVYTFEWTTALALEACAAAGKEVVVLDRPKTLGELAALVNLRMADGGGRPVRRTDGVGVRCPGRCALTVVPMEGWRRRMLFPDTGLPWVLPSPNMPTFDTAVVYPGQVLLEGTNVSEGRGTTRPFEIFGAPWLDLGAVRRRFEKRRLPGLILRDHAFEPTFHKWARQACQGFQIQVTDVQTFRPYATTLALLQDIIATHRDRFEWKQPPYEYVTDRPPIDVLTGDPALREALESGSDLREIERRWRKEIAAFARESGAFRLYD